MSITIDAPGTVQGGRTHDRPRSLSLELFPPRPGRFVSQTWGALDRLLGTLPDFVSVTYRPRFVTEDGQPLSAGEHRHRSVRVLKEHNPAERVIAHVLETSNVPLMAHLTCIGYQEASAVEIIKALLDLGVRRFLALRGDPPTGCRAEDVAGDLTYAVDLVRVIRKVEAEHLGSSQDRVQIAVATYPAAPDHGREAEILAAKQAAGADLAITQVFYDSQDYLTLCRTAQERGATLPILPGVIPLTDLRRLSRLERLSGVPVPERLARTLRDSQGAAAMTAGIKATLKLATEVLEGGAPGIHLYTFNRTRPALDVISHLRLGGILDGYHPSRQTQREVTRSYLNAVPGGDPRTVGRMPTAAQP